MPSRHIVVCVALAVAVAVVGVHGDQLRPRTDPTPLPAPSLAASTAVELLDGLTIAAETNTDSYTRERFGAGWATAPDGCDTRTQVLVAETLTPAVVEACTVAVGAWLSVYDGAHTTDPAALDVDHMVPLAEAWTSGAAAWNDNQRVAFANDLDPARPDALVAVTAAANRSKGDRDPAGWMPPDRGVWCRYATAWITQKAAWHLTVDAAEHQALTDALTTCPAATGEVGR